MSMKNSCYFRDITDNYETKIKLTLFINIANYFRIWGTSVHLNKVRKLKTIVHDDVKMY